MDAREPAEGTSFGRYQLIELLERGEMGEVWRAHDTTLDRTVAIKMLLPRYASDPEFAERFRRDARSAARLDDPHVVPIYDVGEIDGRHYVTMRLEGDPPDPAYARQWSPAGDQVVGASPTPAHRNPRRRTAIAIGALVTAVLLVAGGVFVATRPSDESATGADTSTSVPSPTTPTGPPPNTGPLTGVFRADFGPITHLNDVPGPDPSKASDRFAIRSTCLPTGCVAHASRLEGTVAYAKPFVLDQIGDRWFSVGLTTVPCKTEQATEAWEVLSLRPQPDGRLAGEFMSLTSNDCLMKRTVILTRTGDVDVESLPDPASIPPRVVTPAEGLWGQYTQTRMFPRYGQQQQTTLRVNTHCLRTGDRCMSFLWGPNGEANPLVFGDGAWTLLTESDSACRGSAIHVKKTGRYPLPDAPGQPIAELSGTGRQSQTAPCATEVEFSETITRTGD